VGYCDASEPVVADLSAGFRRLAFLESKGVAVRRAGGFGGGSVRGSVANAQLFGVSSDGVYSR
jgi:hypothetical protein